MSEQLGKGRNRSRKVAQAQAQRPLGRPCRPDDTSSGIMPILGMLLLLAVLYALVTAII